MKFETLQVTRYEQNCSILWCEITGKAAVIDPGGDIYLIEDYLDWLELELEVILVTHGHGDHCGGAAELSEATGARVEGPHRGDQDLVKNLAAQNRRLGLNARPYIPFRWLEDGDRVRIGEMIVEVLHCPGHSKGHVAYFHQQSRQAFVGDILFHDAIGAWEHPDGNLADLVTSIRSKLFPLGDDVQFVPGHGPVSTFGRERRENPFVGDNALSKWKRPLPKLHL